MSRNLSNAAKAAIFSQETNEAFIMLLTITHPDYTDDIRLASDSFEVLPDAGVRGVISRGLEYIYLPFSVNMPSQDDTGISKANISIDNIDREIVAAVRRATSALTVRIEVIRADDPDYVEMSVIDFKLEKVSYDAFTVSGDISVEYYDLEPFPARRFTPTDFPGIF